MNWETTMGWSSEDKAEKYNRTEGNLQGYDCPICKNKGNVMLVRDGNEFFQECDCMEIRRGKRRLEKSGLADMVERYRFDTFEVEKGFQETMLSMAQAFCREGKGWFYIGGQAGSGKTHICTAIANSFLSKGKSVQYMIWMEEIGRLKALRMDEEAYEREMERWRKPEVLYIDDFFKTKQGGMPTDADVSIAFELINGRYNDQSRITIFSGERTMNEMIEIDEALGSRIYQRCGKFMMSIGKDRGKNWRLRGKR